MRALDFSHDGSNERKLLIATFLDEYGSECDCLVSIAAEYDEDDDSTTALGENSRWFPSFDAMRADENFVCVVSTNVESTDFDLWKSTFGDDDEDDDGDSIFAMLGI